MKIDIHPQALKNIDVKATGLLSKLFKVPPQENKDTSSTASTANLYAVDVDISMVKDMVLRSVDGFGTEYSRFFQTEEGMMGYDGQTMREVIKFVEELSKQGELSKITTKDYLLDNFFSWVRGKYIGEINKDITYGKFLQDALSTDVRERTLAFPLSFINLVKPISCGDVELNYYGEEFFKKYRIRLLEEHPQDNKKIGEHVRSLRKKYQGKVVAIVKAFGVQDKCIELATVKIGDFMQVLRFYSPTALVPDIPSHFNTMGNEFTREAHVFIVDNDQPIIINASELESYPFWDIDSTQLEHFKKSGFWKAVDVYNKENKTDLEDLWFRAVKIFNKAVIEREYHIKYVFLFAALESLFIADGSEPILRSLSQRVAIFTKERIEQRTQVVKNIKEAYQRRSRYLHHGSTQNIEQVMRDFQLNAWNAIYHVLLNLERFKTKNELIASLDSSLLS